MNAIALSITRGGPFLLRAPSQGVSADATEIEGIVDRTRVRFQESIAIGQAALEAIEALAVASREAAAPNWDGHRGLPINQEAITHSLVFLQALPTTVPAPNISVDPDGEVDLLWHVSPTRTLSISVGPGGRLTYSALIGDAESFGTEWLSDEIPESVLSNLSRVLRTI